MVVWQVVEKRLCPTAGIAADDTNGTCSPRQHVQNGALSNEFRMVANASADVWMLAIGKTGGDENF